MIARLDQFLCRNGVATNERVTMISDDADKFAPGQGRILDWFRIAMKFKAVDGDKCHDGVPAHVARLKCN